MGKYEPHQPFGHSGPLLLSVASHYRTEELRPVL
jgi:hypothetical protein